MTGRAYYARQGGSWAGWWTILHPPYTMWNLGYVVWGAALAPQLDPLRLALALAAFFGGTGIASHALDELHGRPLRTGLTDGQLKAAALAGFALAGAAALAGAVVISPWILAWAVAGGLLVAAYSLEWFGGLVHSALGFGLCWGAFPVLAGHWAMAEGLSVAAVAGALAATLLSLVQRGLSTPARQLRRRAVSGALHLEGLADAWDGPEVLRRLEAPLRLLPWFVVAVAVALAARHFGAR